MSAERIPVTPAPRRAPLLEDRLSAVLVHRPASVIGLEGEARRAAVAVVVRARRPAPGASGAGPDVLLIKRAAYEGDPWSGHVALPGGRQEAGETLVETVVRETREETAIDLSRSARLLGRLDDVQPRSIMRPRLVITPFVAALTTDTAIATSEEVAEAFWVPVSVLQDPAASRSVVLELGGGPRTVPSFSYRGYVIWGLTERILRQFLAVVDAA